MGLIGRAIGVGQAAGAIGEAAQGLSEVFVANATRQMELDAEIHRATMETAASEFQHAGAGLFDRVINGLNRLPRPMLALGTLGLFVFAMVDPAAFAARMVGLDAVPEPLWWLLGAIVSFYFGARELHYVRRAPVARGGGLRAPWRRAGVQQAPAEDPVAHNPALSAWRNAGAQDPSSAFLEAAPRSQ
ncbi:holin family protein [Roseicyclus mahoneyensis]|uniref:Holin (3TMs family) n=1 Tax=Roseicyclus mahoneyensis TaxID=164332 RepID=A0A316GN96_9RHOB|nr:holin family protein [Roseicyclus mahoneyensis]PWK62505.1 holin (3TMs family) [Roseicyclus mahoneyensis]